MNSTLNLTCPSCNSKLQIPRDVIRFACETCGSELVVDKRGGIVVLRTVSSEASNTKDIPVGTNIDRTSAELAIARLRKDIEELTKEYRTISGDDNTSAIIWGGLGVLVGIIFIANDGAPVGLFIGIPSLLILVFAIYTTNKNSIRKRELSQKIQKKQREISKYEKIVR